MPNFQLGDTEKVPYALTELDADSNPTPGVATDVISITSSDTTMATVAPDAAPVTGSVASGFIVGGKTLGTVTINATVTHADGTSLSVVDVIDIVPGVAATLSLGLGAPVPQ